ncbi:hypothetical protein FAGKG844_30019 [Frankia sp. AgKG'84/4]
MPDPAVGGLRVSGESLLLRRPGAKRPGLSRTGVSGSGMQFSARTLVAKRFRGYRSSAH